MSISLFFIRAFFACVAILLATTYATTNLPGGVMLLNILLGAAVGVSMIGAVFLVEKSLSRLSIRNLVIGSIGISMGYLLGILFISILDVVLNLTGISQEIEGVRFGKMFLFLGALYFSILLTRRIASEYETALPFVQVRPSHSNKKDMLLDWTILVESRILELAASGLLDGSVVIPQFLFRELYALLESQDEGSRTKAARCLENLKKLEGLPALHLRYVAHEFPEIKDFAARLVHLARILGANVLTGDVSKLQPYLTEEVRAINIHMLASALKPITGEQLTIKIQRYGKEPRQGVGYLDDGTMVVVNGGAEYIGDLIKAHVLSVKHTTTGRMIFCNAAEEKFSLEPVSHYHGGGLEEKGWGL